MVGCLKETWSITWYEPCDWEALYATEPEVPPLPPPPFANRRSQQYSFSSATADYDDVDGIDGDDDASYYGGGRDVEGGGDDVGTLGRNRRELFLEPREDARARIGVA